MRFAAGKIRLAATDLSNHLACRRVSTLDLEVARGKRTAPEWAAPDLAVLQQLGLRHETEYLIFLEQVKKLSVVHLGELKSDKELLEETRRQMAQGAEVI